MARHTHRDRLTKRQRVRAGRKKESLRAKRAARKAALIAYWS